MVRKFVKKIIIVNMSRVQEEARDWLWMAPGEVECRSQLNDYQCARDSLSQWPGKWLITRGEMHLQRTVIKRSSRGLKCETGKDQRMVIRYQVIITQWSKSLHREVTRTRNNSLSPSGASDMAMHFITYLVLFYFHWQWHNATVLNGDLVPISLFSPRQNFSRNRGVPLSSPWMTKSDSKFNFLNC